MDIRVFRLFEKLEIHDYPLYSKLHIHEVFFKIIMEFPFPLIFEGMHAV